MNPPKIQVAEGILNVMHGLFNDMILVNNDHGEFDIERSDHLSHHYDQLLNTFLDCFNGKSNDIDGLNNKNFRLVCSTVRSPSERHSFHQRVTGRKRVNAKTTHAQ